MNIPELIERLREWPTGLDLTDIDKAVEALLAQQVCLKQKDAALQRCTKFTQEDYDALDLKPHAALVAKLKADAVREFVDSAMPTKLLQKLGHEYADRIERVEV